MKLSSRFLAVVKDYEDRVYMRFDGGELAVWEIVGAVREESPAVDSSILPEYCGALPTLQGLKSVLPAT